MTALPEHGAAFLRATSSFRSGPPLVLCHDDADGLSAGALLARAFARSPHGTARIRIVGRGESAWAPSLRAEIAALAPAGIVIVDLGVQAEPVLPDIPTVFVDHHVPRSLPAAGTATVVSGQADEPAPTSSLLAFACAEALIGQDAAADLLWLAGLGLIGDLGERGASSDFPEVMTSLKKAHSLKALREAVSLINAQRRSSSGDASPALRVLMRSAGPEEVVSGQDEDTMKLHEARAEVKAALEVARKVPPLFAGPVALIRCDSPCQIHALTAQSWIHRLRRQVVIAANAGFREGYVHFAARSASVPDLISFLQEHAPPLGPDDQFAQGHRRATGGQVRAETWNRFVAQLGFGRDAEVPVRL
ncbi:DHH family phosphoesterase [Methylobacterium sp. P31]